MYNDVLVPAVLLLSPVSVGLSVTMDMMEAVPTCASTLALYWSWKVNASFYCARTSLSWRFLALTESKIQTILEESRASFILILVDEIWVRGLQQEGGVLKDDLQWQNWCPLLQAALNPAIWLSPLFDCPKHSRRPVDSILDAVFTVSPKRQYRGMVSPTTPATQGPERHSSHVTWIHWKTNLIFSSDTFKKPTGNTEEGFMKISLALVLAAISQKSSVAPGFMLMFHVWERPCVVGPQCSSSGRNLFRDHGNSRTIIISF